MSDKNSEIKIDFARPEDARDLQVVFYETWLDTYPNEEYGVTVEDIHDFYKNAFTEETIKSRAEKLANLPGNMKLLVARDYGRVIGLCRIILHPEKNQLQAIYVLPEYQRLGIGMMLWNQAQELLNKSKETIVEVAVYNKRAISFYEKLGFKDTGKRFEEERFKMKSGGFIPEMEMSLDKEVDAPRPNLNLDTRYLEEVANLIQGKGEVEDIHFEYLTDALSALGINVDIYDLYLYEEKADDIRVLLEQSFLKANTDDLSEGLVEKLHTLWDCLAQSDSLERADLIFVFGGVSQLCVEEAVRLKKEGYAPRILFSGKRASYARDIELAEAEQYANFAIENGVAQDDILTEKDSINTPENIVKSASLLKSLNFEPKKIIAVSLPYHSKRAYLTMKAGFDWDVEIIRHPGQSAKYSRENYYKDMSGWSYIVFEYLKMYGARKMGHF